MLSAFLVERLEVGSMKVLVAQRKGEKKLRYYNGRQFVIGKNRAVDIGKMNNEETINKYIQALYDYLATTPEAGTIEYFTMDI